MKPEAAARKRRGDLEPGATGRLSPLSVHGGFIRGWAVGRHAGGVPVHLWMDGQHVGTELTGIDLPASILSACGAPPRAACGFMFALPPGALDGFPHDLHVGLPGTEGESLHGEVQTWRSGPVRGEVRQQQRNFVGCVWFDRLPPRAATLVVADVTGKTRLKHPLVAGAQAERHGYPAAFSIPCEDLPGGPLTFSCAGQSLRGSPRERRVSVLGLVEEINEHGIRGWAFDAADVGRPLELCLRVDGRAAAWFRPNAQRPEIAARLAHRAGLIGFQLPLPDGIVDGREHRIEVVAADDGELLKQGMRIVKFERAWVCGTAQAPIVPSQGQAAGIPRARAGQTPVVSAIVLNRNGEGVLRHLLQSWATHNESVATELIVIDHASTDGSLALLEQWSGRLPMRVAPLDRNDSFSASCNRGAAMAQGEHLLFLNNDVVWLHDALPRMLESLRDPEVGIVGMKLIKEVGESQHALSAATAVQHLGVRFKINDGGYWPYEAEPSPEHPEAEYSPQAVPAVTGAALLCRKVDFDAVGGFDTAYFYGFEDVEFCLRLSQRLHKLVVSRNDACALHRHGHTRLSGRDMSIFERVQRNSAVLASHAGVWLKQAYWRSLLQGDGFITNELLTIGIVVDANPADAEKTPLLRDARTLARDLRKAFPRSRIVFMPPSSGWKQAMDLHVLVVGTPDYDIRALQGARADLLTLAWVRSQPARWVELPWWNEFGDSFGQAQRQAGPVVPSLFVGRWRLRTEIVAHGFTQVAQAAQRALRAKGIPCRLVTAGTSDAQAPMADVRITVLGAGPEAAPAQLRDDVLNVVWLCEPGARALHDAVASRCLVTRTAPTAAWLHQAMEDRIGSTFHPS